MSFVGYGAIRLRKVREEAALVDTTTGTKALPARFHDKEKRLEMNRRTPSREPSIGKMSQLNCTSLINTLSC